MPKHTQSNAPKKPASYFEAIIQVRPHNKDVLNYIIKKTEERKIENIAKIEPKKEGVDVYMSSQRFAIALGKKLKATFRNGTVKVTRSLYSRSRLTGKNIYRVTVLFRCEST